MRKQMETESRTQTFRRKFLAVAGGITGGAALLVLAQLAIKNRRAKRIWQCVAGVLIGLVVLTLVLVLLNAVAFGAYDTEVQSQTQTMSLVPNLTEREGSL